MCPWAIDCAVTDSDIVLDVASGTRLSPDEAGQSTRSRQSCSNWLGAGCDCRRSISAKLLAWSSLARSPPPPSRRATGPTGSRQELEAVNRWRLLRRFRRRCLVEGEKFRGVVGFDPRCARAARGHHGRADDSPAPRTAATGHRGDSQKRSVREG